MNIFNSRGIACAVALSFVAFFWNGAALGQMTSTYLKDHIYRGDGVIDILKDVSGESLSQYFSESNGKLFLGADVNEDNSGNENRDSLGIAIKSVQLNITTSEGDFTFTDFYTGTTAMLRENGSSVASEYYTMFGTGGSSQLTGNNGFDLNAYDDVLMMDNISFAGTVQSATLSITFLETPDEKLATEAEQFFDFSGGFEDFALLSMADARTLENADLGMADAPAEVSYTVSPGVISEALPPAVPTPPLLFLCGIALIWLIRRQLIRHRALTADSTKTESSDSSHFRHFGPVIPLLAAGSLILSSCGRNSSEEGKLSLSENERRVTASVQRWTDKLQDGPVSVEDFEKLPWTDVEPVFLAASQTRNLNRIMKLTESVNAASVIYIRGLVSLAGKMPAQARDEWSAINPAEIPPEFLYAPWRLHEGAPAKENVYDVPLRRAVEEGKVSDLICARFFASHGEWRRALDFYLKSDPAQWAGQDVAHFRSMRMMAPSRREASIVLIAAMRGGRVPERLREPVTGLVRSAPELEKASMRSLLTQNPELAAAATRVAERSLSLRQAFAGNAFGKVVEMIRGTPPDQATDEMVLLGMLSSARIGEESSFEGWSEEWRRRYPDAESRLWLTQIKNDMR